MRRIAKIPAAVALGLTIAALASCTPPPNPYGPMNGMGGAPVGSSGGRGWQGQNSNYAPPSSAGTVMGGTIDSAQSDALTGYLKRHHLPLVKGQVVSSAAGGQQVILFGFVATDYGKSDAEHRARAFLKDPNATVDNRIKVSPELAGGGNADASARSNPAPDNADPYASSNAIQDYQNQPGVDAYTAQQYQQYGSSASSLSPSMLTLMLPLLIGGGSFGGSSYGSFGSGYPSPGYGTPGYGGYPPAPAWGPPPTWP